MTKTDMARIWREVNGSLRWNSEVDGFVEELLKRQAATQEKLHTFVDCAAGEGLILEGVCAAELYVELFPTRYEARLKG